MLADSDEVDSPANWAAASTVSATPWPVTPSWS
jgi:hypothetical protein